MAICRCAYLPRSNATLRQLAGNEIGRIGTVFEDSLVFIIIYWNIHAASFEP